ncbi:MAG: putative DNA binding domain-containing protein [Salinivirgaceae bacterium]|nr:putative DNA binding domain-containing protein [Salinivirgaceae bacterium]
MTETNRIELKRELTDELDIEKEVIAFLNNREGGIIYVGFDKDGKVVGVKDIDGDMLKMQVYDRSCFTFMPNFTRITIKNFNATENVALNVTIELTDRQSNILNLIDKNVALNTTMLSEQLNVDRKTIQRDLKVLLDNNLIKREGSNRYGYWVIPDKNKNEIR